jgi:protein ImuB
MRRVLAVWLPTFSTDVVIRAMARGACSGVLAESGVEQRNAGRPPTVLLTTRAGGAERVAHACALARREGIVGGMTLAQARTLLPARGEVLIRPHGAYDDARALRRLALWAQRVCPTVGLDTPDGLLMDITGTHLLYPSERVLLRSVARGINRLGFACRLATAPSFACARAAARFGTEALTVVDAGHELGVTGAYPVAALGVDDRTAQGLKELGVVRVEQVVKMPRSALAARFGAEVVLRVDRLLGRLDERIEAVRGREPTQSEVRFEGPSDRWEALEAAGRRALELLLSRLASSQRGVRTLDVLLHRPEGERERVNITLSRASANVKHLWSLLRARLARVDLGGGHRPESTAATGIEGLTLTALRTAVLRTRQIGDARLGAGDDRHGSDALQDEVIDVLVERLGAERVRRIARVSSHIPENARVTVSVMQGGALAGSSPMGWDEDRLPPRPARMFDPAQRAGVMALTPDGPVTRLRWNAREYAVVACVGPERIEAEWWRWETPTDRDEGRKWRRVRRTPSARPPARDYFSVQIEGGRWLWVYRATSERKGEDSCKSAEGWFVHGEWC